METLVFFKGTDLSPEVSIKDNGSVYITGNSIMEDPHSFYQPISKLFSKMHVKYFDFNISLDEVNTESTGQLLALLESAKTNPHIDSLRVLWISDENEDNNDDQNKNFEEILGKPNEFLAR